MVGKGRDRPCHIHGQTPEGGAVLPTDGYKYILLYLLRLFKLNAIGGSQRANANCKSHGGYHPGSHPSYYLGVFAYPKWFESQGEVETYH